MTTKRSLFHAIVTKLSEIGVPEHDIKIILVEVQTENWGIRGGYPASEIELGFRVHV
jgi:phenylpyruvate tautomerase PptA (4-oxalocrotonate tautomerase family)